VLLGALTLGACGGAYAPPGEQLAHYETAVGCVHESLALADAGNGEQVRELRRTALEAAEKVDPQRLQTLHVAMPRHFEGALVQGLRLWVRGAQEDDAELLEQGEQAVRRWDDWYREARREIPTR
jgi:hypothetical protein